VKFIAERVRVYFNRAADFPKVWSVDFGPLTAEITCRAVFLEAPAATQYDGSIPGSDALQPKAWFDFFNVEVEITGGTVTIREIRQAAQVRAFSLVPKPAA
jgi:hypothetical protein